MFGVVSRLRQVKSKALPCLLKYTIKAGAFILAQRSMETTPNGDVNSSKWKKERIMLKLTLHWEYFKSTLVLNMSTSVLLAFIVHFTLMTLPKPPPFYIVYIRCCMFGGPLLCLLYKEMSRKNEYYFYYNRGISKLSLFITTLSTYILTGYLLIAILHYAKLA